MTLRRLARLLATGTAAVMALAIAAFFSWRSLAQSAVAESRVVDPAVGIERLEKVRIGGIDQWISIRGRDRRNPVILFLHGGPGFPMMPFSHTFQTPWEEHFTVVQWDQRGTGKTFADNDPQKIAPTMTLERMVEDAHELALYLTRELEQPRIIVIGHSWGSMIGIPLVKKYPDAFAAYVGTGQVINVQDNERVGYERALQVARQRNHREALAALEAIAPYPNSATGTSEPRRVLRRWQREFGFATFGKSDREILLEMLSAGLRSPEYSLSDNLTWLRLTSSTFSRDALAAQIDAFDVRPLGYEFEVPVFLFLGRHDWQVPAVIAAEYYTHISAPTKAIVWFERSAHTPPSEEPERFLQALLHRVRPAAVGRIRDARSIDANR